MHALTVSPPKPCGMARLIGHTTKQKALRTTLSSLSSHNELGIVSRLLCAHLGRSQLRGRDSWSHGQTLYIVVWLHHVASTCQPKAEYLFLKAFLCILAPRQMPSCTRPKCKTLFKTLPKSPYARSPNKPPGHSCPRQS